MKKIAYVMVAVVALSMTACGSSKKVERESPIETFVQPCSELKTADGMLRAWGMGRSDNETTARTKAKMQASAELAEQLQQVVLATAEDYTTELSGGIDAASKRLLESTVKTVTKQTLTGTVIVCDEWHKDEQTGLITNYVTMEIDGEEFLNNLYKKLEDNKLVNVDKELLTRLFMKQIGKKL